MTHASPAEPGDPVGAAGPAARADRAAAAERAVLTRHVRRLWGVPGTALGVNTWPARYSHRLFVTWNYWWHAHLLDCLVDAELRSPGANRRRAMRRLARSLRVRNVHGWLNNYYDDIAWLGLALHRGAPYLTARHAEVVAAVVRELRAAWSDAEGGGIPWRRGDEFKNAPANGPAAILLARCGDVEGAGRTVDWIDARLRDTETGLIWDGVRPGAVERVVYTYCQGAVLGADWEVARRTGSGRERVHALVAAVDRHLAPGGVLRGHAGGDSGLFSGILARYLALVGTELPVTNDAAGDTADDTDHADRATRAAARRLVLDSADAAWRNSVPVDGLPVFGYDWSTPAVRPTTRDRRPERDLSVQLSGWMLLEAAAAVARPAPAPE